ncbi:MAG: tetratricopeptide repeat protein [Anaerolineales bacterium]|nr:tetratricopeptide repeat protein [Anaerolineales bacterium]
MNQPTHQEKESPEIQRLITEIEIARTAGEYEKLPGLYPAVINQYLQHGNAPRALTLINEGVSLAEEHDDLLFTARLKGLEGLALRQIGNPKQALKAFKKSEQLGRKLDHVPILMDAMAQIGKIHAERGDYEQAVKPLEKAYRTAFENQDSQREMYLSGLQGDTYLAMGQHGKAMEFYAIGLEKAQSLEKLEPQCSYQIAIGKIYLEKEDYGPAEEHFKNALDLGSRLGHAGYEFQAFEHLLQLSIQKDDLPSALFHGQKAVQLAREIKDLGAEAANISKLVDYLLIKGKYQQALKYLDRGLHLAEEAHDQEWQLKMISDLAVAHYYSENLETAEKFMVRGLEIAVHLQKKAEEIILRSQLSALKADQGKIEESLIVAEEALELARKHSLPLLEGDQNVLMGLAHYELGNREKARQFIQQGVEIYQELNRLDLMKKAENYLEEISQG